MNSIESFGTLQSTRRLRAPPSPLAARHSVAFPPLSCYRPYSVEKKLFDEVVLLIMGLALSYFGLFLSFAPHRYKAFAGNLDQPVSRTLARSPIWLIRGFGILLISAGLAFFYMLMAK